jgi:hypothetical protein
MSRARSLSTALSLILAAGCKGNTPTPTPTPAPTTTPAPAAADAGPAISATVPDAPANALLTVRGAALKKVLTIMAPGAPTRLVLGQMLPGITPGIGDQALDVDPDAPFAAVLVPSSLEGPDGRLALVAAWPLRPGMDIAQRAQARRGFREAAPGLYEPTEGSSDAGAGAPCWVARRPTVGWLMLCGPRDLIRPNAAWLVPAATSAPSAQTVVDVAIHSTPARRIFANQLAALDAMDPRRQVPGRADAGRAPSLEEFETARRGLLNTKQIADDLTSFHAALTLDDSNYHLRAEAEFAHATGSSSRALVNSSVGRQAPADLLTRLPAAATAWFVAGFDAQSLTPLLAPLEADARALRALGPEFVRFQQGVTELGSFRRSGTRAMGFTPAEGGTRYEIMRVTDASAAVQQVRNQALAVPRTPRPSGENPSNYFALLPAPATLPAGALHVRLGPDPTRLPPSVPEAMRRSLRRSVLLVPQGDVLTLIEAADPVARWTALAAAPKLQATVGERDTAVVHLTPTSLLSFLGVPTDSGAPTSDDPIHGTLTSRRVSDDGAHFDLSVDASIPAINAVRALYMMIQQQQQQMMEQARRAAQQGGAPGAPGGPGMVRRRGPMMPVPTSPDQLPEPDFQLRGPAQ